MITSYMEAHHTHGKLPQIWRITSDMIDSDMEAHHTQGGLPQIWKISSDMITSDMQDHLRRALDTERMLVSPL